MNKRMCRGTFELNGSWGREALWPGLVVDLDRELEPGYTVGDAIKGRDDSFEAVAEDAGAGPPADTEQ